MRDPDHDDEAIKQLLAEFVRSNDKASSIVLNDALIENGYEWAAFDLRDSLARRCRDRRGLANRILSEVLNDSTVLEHGEWTFNNHRGGQNPYVLILERTPIHFRGGTRRGTTRKHEPRVVIWTRAGGSACRWLLYGSYGRSEYGTIEDAVRTARGDIRDQRDRNDILSHVPDYESCGDCGFDHEYEYEEANAWHRANPGSYSPEPE